MYKHTFDFGSTPIEIFAENKIEKKVLDKIHKLIQFIRFDFNYKIHHSSAYELNDIDLETPIKVSPEFIYYLKVNLEKAIFSKLEFNPFRTDSSPEDSLLIEETEVVKKSNFFFDSTALMLSFTIDQITSILVENKLTLFLISTKDIHSAIGKKKWDIKFELDNNSIYELEIQNESAGLAFNKDYSKQKASPQVKFGFKDPELIMKYAIFKASNAISFKVISKILEKKTRKSEYQEFSTLNNSALHIIDKNDEEITVKPYRD